jgi:hypothetical protein
MNHDQSLTKRDKTVSFLRVHEKFTLPSVSSVALTQSQAWAAGLKMLANPARMGEKLHDYEQ